MRLDLDRLARMGTTADRRTAGFRRITLDSGMTVHLPRARDLAGLVIPSPGRELFRRRDAIAWRPIGSDLTGDALTIASDEAVSGRLLDLLAALPDRRDVGPAWLSLRDLARHEPERAKAETLAAARSLRMSLDVAPEPKAETVERGPAMTPGERLTAHRERRRNAERGSSAYWLDLWLHDDDAPEPGSRVLAASLYADAADALEMFADDEETLDDDEDEEKATRIVVPRRRVFYEVADEVLGPRTRTKIGTAYTVPQEARMTVAEAILDRAARMLLEENRDALGTLLRDELPTVETAPVRPHLRAV